MEIVRTHDPLEVAFPCRRVLVCDGDDGDCALVSESLRRGYDITFCSLEDDVGEILRRGYQEMSPYEILLWGVDSAADTGLERLCELREAFPGLRTVLLAPQEALASAPMIRNANVEALVLKPLHSADIRSGIERALRKNPLVSSVTSLLAPLASARPAPPPSMPAVAPSSFAHLSPDGRDLGLIGVSREMQRVVSLVRKVGPSSVNVLITGESGTGKEMVANAIHQSSPRAGKPFVAINCAAIPRDLLESELFGHARGAFTGASVARRGLFEEAHEGTVLLDEIGDLPLQLQAKILRLLQTRQVKPLGQNTIKEVDVRIISATHKNLKGLIQKGEFREDLFYRLNVMPIHLPALRERKEDILVLAEHFLQRFARRRRSLVPALSRAAESKLISLPWKGNVRELENVIERAVVLAEGTEIGESEIFTDDLESSTSSGCTAEDLFKAGMTLKDIEREYIKYVLEQTGNRKEAATRILGIDRKTLYRKERAYGIRQLQ